MPEPPAYGGAESGEPGEVEGAVSGRAYLRLHDGEPAWAHGAVDRDSEGEAQRGADEPCLQSLPVQDIDANGIGRGIRAPILREFRKKGRGMTRI